MVAKEIRGKDLDLRCQEAIPVQRHIHTRILNHTAITLPHLQLLVVGKHLDSMEVRAGRLRSLVDLVGIRRHPQASQVLHIRPHLRSQELEEEATHLRTRLRPLHHSLDPDHHRSLMQEAMGAILLAPLVLEGLLLRQGRRELDLAGLASLRRIPVNLPMAEGMRPTMDDHPDGNRGEDDNK